MLVEKSIVLVGSVKNQNPTTFGTGVLVSYNSRLFIITCKHVVNEAGNVNLFAIPNPKKTKNPRGGYKILGISKLHFHPNETLNESFDIVVCELNKINKVELRTLKLSYISLKQNMFLNNINKGDKIVSYGFPVDYAENLLNQNREESLHPLKIQSIVKDLPIIQLVQTGFVGSLNEGFFSETDIEICNTKGNSGGLLTITENDELLPYGIVLGSAEFKYKPKDIVIEMKGIVFAKFSRVLEILDSIYD